MRLTLRIREVETLEVKVVAMRSSSLIGFEDAGLHHAKLGIGKVCIIGGLKEGYLTS